MRADKGARQWNKTVSRPTGLSFSFLARRGRLSRSKMEGSRRGVEIGKIDRQWPGKMETEIFGFRIIRQFFL